MGTRAINPLIGALKNPNPFVRQTAAGFFRRVRDAGSITPLIAALADENAQVRAQSALALGIQQDSRAIQALVPLLSDKDQLVHECAAIALGQFGDARAQSDILAALNAHSGYSLSDMRAPAIAALGKLKDPKAIPLILNTAVYWDMEDSRELRAACVDALTAISGQQFGHDYCRWLGWAAAEGNWKPSKQEHPATTERSTTK
jgi:HEAT repeat protein